MGGWAAWHCTHQPPSPPGENKQHCIVMCCIHIGIVLHCVVLTLALYPALLSARNPHLPLYLQHPSPNSTLYSFIYWRGGRLKRTVECSDRESDVGESFSNDQSRLRGGMLEISNISYRNIYIRIHIHIPSSSSSSSSISHWQKEIWQDN